MRWVVLCDFWSNDLTYPRALGFSNTQIIDAGVVHFMETFQGENLASGVNPPSETHKCLGVPG